MLHLRCFLAAHLCTIPVFLSRSVHIWQIWLWGGEERACYNWHEQKGRNRGIKFEKYIDNTIGPLYLDMKDTPGRRNLLKVNSGLGRRRVLYQQFAERGRWAFRPPGQRLTRWSWMHSEMHPSNWVTLRTGGLRRKRRGMFRQPFESYDYVEICTSFYVGSGLKAGPLVGSLDSYPAALLIVHSPWSDAPIPTPLPSPWHTIRSKCSLGLVWFTHCGEHQSQFQMPQHC
jgi:hypothetical protein